jgi:hypothetical protein
LVEKPTKAQTNKTMPLTLVKLKETGRLRPHSNGKKGCFSILPPLKLTCINGGGHPHAANSFFSKGDTVYATSLQEVDQKVGGYIKLRGIGFGWPLLSFDLPKTKK